MRKIDQNPFIWVECDKKKKQALVNDQEKPAIIAQVVKKKEVAEDLKMQRGGRKNIQLRSYRKNICLLTG